MAHNITTSLPELSNTTALNLTISTALDTLNGSLQISTESGSVTDHTPQENTVRLALEYVNYVFLPTVMILGLVGNALTIVIVNTKQYSQFTSALLLTVLAVSDSALLLAQPFNKSFVIKLVGTDVRAISDFGCKFYFIIRRSSKMTSSWFVVFLCLERFIVVWFPLKAKLICTKKIIIAAVTAVYVVIIGYTASWSYASQIVGNQCHPDVYDRKIAYEKNLYGSMLLAASSLYSVIPMVLLSIFTPLIILKLFQQKRLRRRLTKSTGKTPDSSKVTVMLISIVIAYIILITPITTVHNAAFQLKIKAFGDDQVGFSIFKDVAQLLEQINYSINFFLYVATSRKFRARFQDLCSFGIYNMRKEPPSRESTQRSKPIYHVETKLSVYDSPQ